MILDRASRWLRSRAAALIGAHDAGRSQALPRKPAVECLEERRLLTASLPELSMISATTADSKSVTFNYTINSSDVTNNIDFAIYRSADDQLDASSLLLGTDVISAPGQGNATLDAAGQSAVAQGTHQLTYALASPLSSDPSHPYVLVVAEPAGAGADTALPSNTASFRIYTIAVVTHGGLQPKQWKHGPPWELKMAAELRAEGFDAVIPYNWIAESSDPGDAAKQGPRVTRLVLNAASQFPANDPVDITFIGHSEGAVINSLAARYLNTDSTPGIRAGYMSMTMLDPYSANNHVPGGPYYSTTPGFFGWLATEIIHMYQSEANDPLVVVPSDVDSAVVYYQHDPVSLANGSNHGIYNLWGQVPVRGQAEYYDITAPGISHDGRISVPDWYLIHVVPTLGDGDSFPSPYLFTGTLDHGSGKVASQADDVSEVDPPQYSGTAAPGATVVVLARRGGASGLAPIGQTVASADGTWSLSTRPLARGGYQVLGRETLPTDPGQPPLQITPTLFLGPLVIDTRMTASDVRRPSPSSSDKTT